MICKKPIQTLALDLSSSNITTAAWNHVLIAIPKAATLLEVFNPSGSPLMVSQGAIGNETATGELLPWTILPGGSGIAEVELRAGKDIAFKALDANVTTGRFILNLYA